MKSITRRIVLAGIVATGVTIPLYAQAQDDVQQVRFAVDFVWQSNHSIWTLAEDRGYFAEENLEVSIDRGYGSADNMTKLAAGSLDVALVDPNLLPKFNHENPDDQLIAFFIVYDAAPTAVIFRKSSGIEEPKDLEGKRLAATEGSATTILFPFFAALNGIDISKVEQVAVTPQLRDTMVIQGQADASIGFLTTSVLNFTAAGVPRDDVGYFQYSQHGLELYSLAMVCQKEYAEANPEVLRGFVEATIKGARAMIEDPEAAIASVMDRDPLLDKDVELARNELMNEVSLLTPHVREHGISSVDPERFERSLAQVAEAFELPFKPDPDDIYTDQFLPPEQERMID